jgi:hypothetical protein
VTALEATRDCNSAPITLDSVPSTVSDLTRADVHGNFTASA